MQQVPKKIELIWSLAISTAALQGIGALTKSLSEATGILDPHNELRLETHEHDSQKGCLDIVPGQPSRRIVCAKALHEQLVCERVRPDQGTNIAEH
jgi:hypothetical protein